jgi:hypothetical protein
MTIAIPLKHQLDHTELKYCLRSIDKFLTGIPVIIISTNLPYWINNVTQIPVNDVEGRKQLTIKKKIAAALEIDKDIICIHDDVYLLQPFEYKYYSWGDITINKEGGAKLLLPQLQELNKPISHFDIHNPFMYEKNKFHETLETFTSDTVVKSSYANLWHISGTSMPDVKFDKKIAPQVVRQIIKSRPYFSSGSGGIKSLLTVWEELFPDPSRFEI